MKIVHLKTVVQAVLGVMDDEGNITQELVVMADQNKQVDPLLIRKFDSNSFVEAFKAISLVRDDLTKQLEEKVANSSTE